MKASFLVAGLLSLGLTGVANAADVSIYYSPSCPHCHHARDFIKTNLVYEYPDITVTQYNVMNQDNRDLFETVLKKCDYDSGGVPVIVVGEKCFQGYAEFMNDDLRKAIESDLSDEAKAKAKTIQDAMKKDPGQYAIDHASEAGNIVEYSAKAEAKKK